MISTLLITLRLYLTIAKHFLSHFMSFKHNINDKLIKLKARYKMKYRIDFQQVINRFDVWVELRFKNRRAFPEKS